MPTSLRDGLPGALRDVRTTPLFIMRLDVRPLQVIGATPGVYRRVGVVPSGAFEGERVSGQVLDGGSDWQNVRSQGSTTLDVRMVLETADAAPIGMGGIHQGPADIIARVEKGETRLCQSNRRSSVRGATRPPSSDIQAARVRHSANVAERPACRLGG